MISKRILMRLMLKRCLFLKAMGLAKHSLIKFWGFQNMAEATPFVRSPICMLRLIQKKKQIISFHI